MLSSVLPEGGGGGVSPVKMTGMPVVSLRGAHANHGFWSYVGCSG